MKKILILLGLLLIAFLAYYFTRPTDYSVERTGIIDAPISQVWPEVVSFKQWANWSAWAEKDSTMKSTYEGESGTVGSKQFWIGEESGSGNMTITSIVDHKEMNYHLMFTDPFESESDGFVKLEKVEEGTKVTMGFFGKHDAVSRLMNMDKMVGPDFARGIENLKKVIESKPKAPVFEVKTDIFAPKMYLATKHNGLGMDKVIGEFFAENYGKIASQKAKFGNGMPSALYYVWDVDNGTTDMAVAMPLEEKPTDINDGFELIEIAESKCIYIDYYGSYADMEPAHTTLNNYLIDNKLEGEYVAIEEYVTDPASEPNPNKWLTKITYVNLKQ